MTVKELQLKSMNNRIKELKAEINEHLYRINLNKEKLNLLKYNFSFGNEEIDALDYHIKVDTELVNNKKRAIKLLRKVIKGYKQELLNMKEESKQKETNNIILKWCEKILNNPVKKRIDKKEIKTLFDKICENNILSNFEVFYNELKKFVINFNIELEG